MSCLDFLVHMYGSSSALAFAFSLFPRESIITDQLFVTGSIFYPTAIGVILVGSILQCFLGFLFLAYCANFFGSSVIVVLFRAAGPVFIVTESVLFLGETLDRYQVYGGTVILSGVFLTLAPLIWGNDELGRSSANCKNDVVETSDGPVKEMMHRQVD